MRTQGRSSSARSGACARHTVRCHARVRRPPVSSLPSLPRARGACSWCAPLVACTASELHARAPARWTRSTRADRAALHAVLFPNAPTCSLSSTARRGVARAAFASKGRASSRPRCSRRPRSAARTPARRTPAARGERRGVVGWRGTDRRRVAGRASACLTMGGLCFSRRLLAAFFLRFPRPSRGTAVVSLGAERGNVAPSLLLLMAFS